MERFSHWLAWSVVALLAAFAALNWAALTAATSINLLVADVHAPMGVILLGLTGVFVALFVMATLYSRIANLLETRALHKELRLAQDAANKAEASRLEALQQLVRGEFRTLNERLNQLEQAVATKPVSPQPVSPHPVPSQGLVPQVMTPQI
jgi:uncharacterized integral membrane protein